MKTSLVIGMVLIVATVAGTIALFLTIDERSFTQASNSMLPVIAAKQQVNCLKVEPAKLAYGDLVIYRHPDKKARRSNWLKMVVGFSGDKVQMQGGTLWINGKAVPRRRAGEFEMPGTGGRGGKMIPRFEETLPGGVKTFVLDTDPEGPLDNTAPYTVPPGHLFVIGNNRDNSTDSRSISAHGPVPVGDILCKALPS